MGKADWGYAYFLAGFFLAIGLLIHVLVHSSCKIVAVNALYVQEKLV